MEIKRTKTVFLYYIALLNNISHSITLFYIVLFQQFFFQLRRNRWRDWTTPAAQFHIETVFFCFQYVCVYVVATWYCF